MLLRTRSGRTSEAERVNLRNLRNLRILFVTRRRGAQQNLVLAQRTVASGRLGRKTDPQIDPQITQIAQIVW
jgi:hypothetical protein